MNTNKNNKNYISIFSIFRPAVGPSSSHTLAPLLCTRDFINSINTKNIACDSSSRLKVELYGSLAATGRGHLTDSAIIAALAGQRPEETGASLSTKTLNCIQKEGGFRIHNSFISFNPKKDILWRKRIPAWSKHPNTMRFTLTSGKHKIKEQAYISLGAGFFQKLGNKETPARVKNKVPYPFDTMVDLLKATEETGFPISHLVLANEAAFHNITGSEILNRLEQIWVLMKSCINRGLTIEGKLPGGLGVKRRAKRLWEENLQRTNSAGGFLSHVLKANAYALSVSEENAAGGAIVTAPTAGGSGVIPAVLRILQEDLSLPDRTITYGLLTAGAVGVIIKNLASLSGAEVGCQGEVGSASAMAAAAAAELAGGIPTQVEAAAEIAMEHHLGMTCDPVAGLVQIPCIERNAMGAVKALNASAISLAGTGQHLISFDSVVNAMWRTGQDLRTAYRETGRGGLAAKHV